MTVLHKWNIHHLTTLCTDIQQHCVQASNNTVHGNVLTGVCMFKILLGSLAFNYLVTTEKHESTKNIQNKLNIKYTYDKNIYLCEAKVESQLYNFDPGL